MEKVRTQLELLFEILNIYFQFFPLLSSIQLDWLGQVIFREREVEILKLMYSSTSSKSLQNLNGAVRLKYLYLDGCPLATNSGKTNANVFDSLTLHGVSSLLNIITFRVLKRLLFFLLPLSLFVLLAGTRASMSLSRGHERSSEL